MQKTDLLKKYGIFTIGIVLIIVTILIPFPDRVDCAEEYEDSLPSTYDAVEVANAKEKYNECERDWAAKVTFLNKVNTAGFALCFIGIYCAIIHRNNGTSDGEPSEKDRPDEEA